MEREKSPKCFKLKGISCISVFFGHSTNCWWDWGLGSDWTIPELMSLLILMCVLGHCQNEIRHFLSFSAFWLRIKDFMPTYVGIWSYSFSHLSQSLAKLKRSSPKVWCSLNAALYIPSRMKARSSTFVLSDHNTFFNIVLGGWIHLLV